MCGIVGMAGDLSTKDLGIFEDMLDVVQLRGRHSTGAIRIDRSGDNYAYAKRVGPPAYLFDSKEYDSQICRGSISVLIGHGRHKTVGDIDIKSAHPFDYPEEGVIGVHNGTLKNYHRFPEQRMGMVDSQVLYERIATLGPQETFEDLEGAWACVWWDNNTKKINFIRNKERPLYVTYSEDRRKMFWASEPWMFGAVSRKQDLWEGAAKGRSPYIRLEEDVLYQIEVDPTVAKGKPVFKVSEGKKIEKKSKPVVGFKNTTIGKPTTESSTSTNKKGGEVADPFLDDPLPSCLLLPAKVTPTAQNSTTTGKNLKTSSEISKNLSALSPQSGNTPIGTNSTNSPASTSSPSSQKTNKRKLSVVQGLKPGNGSPISVDTGNIYQAKVGVDTRYIKAIDTEFITNMRTGREVAEDQFKKETGGKCCHCHTKIRSVSEVAEIFSTSRFICNECVQPPLDLVPEMEVS